MTDMTGTPSPTVERIAGAVADVVERVAATVAEIRDEARAVLASAEGGPSPTALETQVRTLLAAPGQMAVGLGGIVAPRPENGHRRALHWWQVDPVGGRVVTLDPDLRQSSLGFYDYTAADWFDVPKRTARRHVVGPYVDVHGTGQYVLTHTEPVVSDGTFLGVLGADIPAARFENHLLRALADVDEPFLVLNEDDRVVLSTAPPWLVGDLVRAPAALGPPDAGTPGLSWRVHRTRG
jgi:hypothetical protein